MPRYLVVFEPAESGFSAHAPDLPGCIAFGATPGEVEQNMREAVEFHLEGLREGAKPSPPCAAPRLW